MRTIVAVLLAMLSSLAAGAQVNKCLDASGKVVAYGAECPAGTRAEETKITNTPAAPSAGAQKSAADRDAEFRKRQVESQEASAKAAKKADDDKRRAEACERARGYAKQLQEGQRIARTDPKTGERSFLDGADYAKERDRAQRSVSENCK